MASPVAFLNGEYIPLEQAKVGIMTHALHYGTGVFEGLRGNWNEEAGKTYIFKLEEHYDRMLAGCKMLWIDLPYSVEELCRITVEVVERSGYQEDLYIRPVAYKSEEKVANLNLRSLADGFFCLAVPFGSYLDSSGAISCCVASYRRIDDTMVPPRFKLSGLYLNSILAKTDALAAGFDEAIMLNTDGHVCEGTGENIFLVHGDTIATPTIESNVLPGITRATVIDLAQDELGLRVEQRPIDRSELYTADEVFLTGTAAHIQGVGSVDHRPVGDGAIGAVTRRFQDLYFPIVQGRNPAYMHQLWSATPKVTAS
ncbi:MAG: branched-chain amino acid transaminase [Chloroflexi bacterium]|nr:branched-chain amino acid transaminase [Chloroflexota bacterium]